MGELGERQRICEFDAARSERFLEPVELGLVGLTADDKEMAGGLVEGPLEQFEPLLGGPIFGGAPAAWVAREG